MLDVHLRPNGDPVHIGAREHQRLQEALRRGDASSVAGDVGPGAACDRAQAAACDGVGHGHGAGGANGAAEALRGEAAR